MHRTSLRLGISLLVCAAALGTAGSALAQPGMTPPGSTPPYSPPPASPAPAPADAPPYGDPYAPAPAPEPYYGPPMPPPEPESTERSGFHLGGSIGIGALESDAGEFVCAGCEPVAVSVDVHMGTMLSPQLALQGELWIQLQSLDANNYSTISQTMFMLAAQYWVHPRFWLKAGIGASNLSYSYDDGFVAESESLGSGTALSGALGLELVQAPHFSCDLILKTGVGSYSDRDERVSGTSINLGVNWY